MYIGDIETETWGQPSIYVYRMDSDGESLTAIVLDDYYGELAYSNCPVGDMVTFTQEDIEDIASFNQTFNEPTVSWKDLKQELAKDGLL
jgi:hypothetical protein